MIQFRCQKNHIHPLQDIQFIREASDVQFDETGNRKRKHRYGDEDEIEMEQQERKRRAMLNKEFKAFAEKIAEAASTSVSASVSCRPKAQKKTLPYRMVKL